MVASVLAYPHARVEVESLVESSDDSLGCLEMVCVLILYLLVDCHQHRDEVILV